MTPYLFPSLTKSRPKTLWGSVRKVLPSQLLVILFLTAVMATFTHWFLGGSVRIAWFDESGFTLSHYFSMMPAVVIMSVIILTWLVFVEKNQDLKEELNELRAINQLLEERQAREESVPETEDSEKCTLEGTSNQQRLVVNPSDIIYIESMSNYADVCYMEEGETRHKTLRTTMKQVRESLADVNCLVSCHRAFIVNVNFIVSISTRPTGGYQLQVFGQDIPIPVARAYTEEIKAKIASKN